MGQTGTDIPTQNMRKVALTALAGTSIEWFDFFIYGTAAALVFPSIFFPDDMPEMVSLIAAFGTFAVGFIARPVGGMVFGYFGDRFLCCLWCRPWWRCNRMCRARLLR